MLRWRVECLLDHPLDVLLELLLPRGSGHFIGDQAWLLLVKVWQGWLPLGTRELLDGSAWPLRLFLLHWRPVVRPRPWLELLLCSRVVASVELVFVLEGPNVADRLDIAWGRLLLVFVGRRWILHFWCRCSGLVSLRVPKMELGSTRLYRPRLLLRDNLEWD